MVTLTPKQWFLVATHGILLCVAIGYKQLELREVRAHEVTKTALLNAQLVSGALKTAIAHQNEAIATMKAEQATAEASAVKAIAVAQAETKDAKKKAAVLLARPQPQGVDSCNAASALFDEIIHAR